MDLEMLLMKLWYEREIKKLLMHQAQRAAMTYEEIEAEISQQYSQMFGRALNWDNPQTYNEKVHVSKVYMPTPEKTRLADKLEVRDWITERVGSQYLIPLLSVHDSLGGVDFDSLPQQFVIKCNHDSRSYTIVNDKTKLKLKKLYWKYERLLKKNFAYQGFEMHYRDIKPKIMIEHYLGDVINEYKFYCFDGQPYYCFATFGRRNVDLSINFYDMDWELQPFTRPDHEAYTGTAPRPARYDEMKSIASTLCKGFGHVRVDMYAVEDRIYIGEMTFTTACGWGKFSPDEWDYKLGALWPFDNTIRKQVLSQRTRP